MPARYQSLTLADAKRMIAAAETKAATFHVAYNLAIVDASGLRSAAITPMLGGSTIESMCRCCRESISSRRFMAPWGNNIDLMEVLALGKVRHTTNKFKFEQINEYLDRMREGEIIGRAVMTW